MTSRPSMPPTPRHAAPTIVLPFPIEAWTPGGSMMLGEPPLSPSGGTMVVPPQPRMTMTFMSPQRDFTMAYPPVPPIELRFKVQPGPTLTYSCPAQTQHRPRPSSRLASAPRVARRSRAPRRRQPARVATSSRTSGNGEEPPPPPLGAATELTFASVRDGDRPARCEGGRARHAAA